MIKRELVDGLLDAIGNHTGEILVKPLRAYANQLVAEIAMLNDHLSDDEIQMGKTATHITEQDAIIERMLTYIGTNCGYCPIFESQCSGLHDNIPGGKCHTELKLFFAEANHDRTKSNRNA